MQDDSKMANNSEYYYCTSRDTMIDQQISGDKEHRQNCNANTPSTNSPISQYTYYSVEDFTGLDHGLPQKDRNRHQQAHPTTTVCSSNGGISGPSEEQQTTVGQAVAPTSVVVVDQVNSFYPSCPTPLAINQQPHSHLYNNNTTTFVAPSQSITPANINLFSDQLNAQPATSTNYYGLNNSAGQFYVYNSNNANYSNNGLTTLVPVEYSLRTNRISPQSSNQFIDNRYQAYALSADTNADPMYSASDHSFSYPPHIYSPDFIVTPISGLEASDNLTNIPECGKCRRSGQVSPLNHIHYIDYNISNRDHYVYQTLPRFEYI